MAAANDELINKVCAEKSSLPRRRGLKNGGRTLAYGEFIIGRRRFELMNCTANKSPRQFI